MMRSHEWFYYTPIECEICLWCGFYRTSVENESCPGHTGKNNGRRNEQMETLLKRLRESRASA